MKRAVLIGSLVGTGVLASVAYFFLPIRSRVIRVAEKELGKRHWEKYLDTTALETPAQRVSWCGLFSLWALHKAGIGKDVMWEWGRGYLYRLPRTQDPKPGDIAYIDQPYQHHAIVEKVVGNTVHTIDGNSPGAAGGIVAKRERPRSSFTAFYSIKPLLPLWG